MDDRYKSKFIQIRINKTQKSKFQEYCYRYGDDYTASMSNNIREYMKSCIARMEADDRATAKREAEGWFDET